MRRPWILDRTDPRAILLVSVAVLVFGVVIAPHYLRQGGSLKVYMLVWLVVSAGQLAWAAYRVWRMRSGGQEDPSTRSPG